MLTIVDEIDLAADLVITGLDRINDLGHRPVFMYCENIRVHHLTHGTGRIAHDELDHVARDGRKLADNP